MNESSLIFLTRADHALAEADSILKLKEYRSAALTAADWAKRKKMGDETVQRCISYATRAQIKLGEVLIAAEKAGEVATTGHRRGKLRGVPTGNASSSEATAADLGLSRKQKKEAKQLAELNTKDKEAVIDGTKTKAEISREQKAEKLAEVRYVAAAQMHADPKAPVIECADAVAWLQRQQPSDLLLTDPPYMTDVDDINKFSVWLPIAWSKIKPTGRGYVFIGAYPDELSAYLTVCQKHNLPLKQVLTWTYKNTMGPSPKMAYFLNYQAVLYLVGPDAGNLDCPILKELCASQEANHPARTAERVYQWQKPSTLVEQYIRHATKPGDTIIDPFAGSGVHLLAAARLGRLAVGCDKSKDAVKLAVSLGCVTK